MTENEIIEAYKQAQDLLKLTVAEDKIAEAAEILRSLGDYENSAALLARCEHFLSFHEGSHVVFGTYHDTPIRWKVLQTSGRLRLLFADNIIDQQQFHVTRDDIDWARCSLRHWLNKDFLEQSFTLQERMSIILTSLQNNTDPRWDHENGPDTKDKAFVFTIKELNEYVPATEDRALGEWWWLRGHGSGNLSQKAVYRDGSVYESGINTNDTVGVRPAMWIRLSV